MPMTRCLLAVVLTVMFLTSCASSPETPPKPNPGPPKEANTPPPRMMTAVRVTGYAGDQADLLKSSNPKYAANKKLAYDFFRVILRGRRLDKADQYMTEDYIQHNPNADTGMAGHTADSFAARG